MKKTIISAVILLFATLFIAAVPTDAEAQIYEDTLRLHILANSNSAEDQRLKLQIRDEVLKKYGAALTSLNSLEDAVSKAGGLIEEIEVDCERWIATMGYSYGVKAEIKSEWYDTRKYEGFTLPCGIYNSLRIIIGDGEGKNWWCVMYPPLCMNIATEQAPSDDTIIDYTKEELSLIKSGKYNIKFKALEALSYIFSKK